MIIRLLGALQFLTVFPVRGLTASPSASAIFFPSIGGLLGASAGLVLLACREGLGITFAALIALIYLVFVTGCLHEDGLADVADAFRVGRSREKIMVILKDSRIGTYGGLALISSVLIRWQALAATRLNPVFGLAAALALSRTALVLLGYFAAPVGAGLGRTFATGLSRGAMLAALVQAVFLSLLLTGWQYGVAMSISTLAIVFLARAWFSSKIGGVNGDCLGATCQLVEICNLLVLVWRPFS